MSNSIRTDSERDALFVDSVIDEILEICPDDDSAEEWLKRRYPKNWATLVEPLRHAVAIRRAERLAEYSGVEEFFDIPPLPSLEKVEFLKYQLSGYSLKQQLGNGGQAEVFEAIQESTGRAVAVKFLREGPLASPSQQARFKREISLVSRLRHPNIVQVYDSGTVAGHNWFSMECVGGARNLDEYVLIEQLTLRSVVELFAQVVRAVGYAHQVGVIHRDIKPSNILVDNEGVPRVVDFGLAKDEGDADDAREAVKEGHILGTLPYLSPEQASGSEEQIDVRSDVYSLGVVLYELLTGQWPNDMSGAKEEARQRIVTVPAGSPSRIRAEIGDRHCLPAGPLNDDLEQIILKSLAKRKEDRYQSAIELADDLARYLAGQAVNAKANDNWYVLRKTAARYRTHIAVTSLFLGLMAASLLVAVSFWQRAEGAANLAQRKLNAAAFFRFGSVARDAGRTDDAIALFKSAIDLAEQTDRPDGDLLAVGFDASVGLARLSLSESEFERADEFVELAEKLLANATKRHTSDLWVAKQSAFRALLGLRAHYAKNHGEAIHHFQSALSTNESLARSYPDDETLFSSRYYLLDDITSSLTSIGCYEDALQAASAKSIAIEDRWIQTQKAEDRINMVLCDADFARIYAKRQKNNLEDHEIALILVRGAKTALLSFVESGQVDGLVRSLDQNITYLDELERWLERRKMILLDWHAGVPHQSGGDPFIFRLPAQTRSNSVSDTGTETH